MIESDSRIPLIYDFLYNHVANMKDQAFLSTFSKQNIACCRVFGQKNQVVWECG